jgi:CelD/BcsL family acetyltransferase involved in cellulose biosynthesis
MLTTLAGQPGSGIGDPGSVPHDHAFGCGLSDPRFRPGARIDIVRDDEQFVALESEWNDAVERASVPHPFLRHEWVRTWWDSFGRSTHSARSGRTDRQLHIIVVREGGRIAGIAPLMRETTTSYGLSIKRLALLANDHTPRTDFVVAGNAAEVYAAIWNTLRDGMDQWDVVQLTQLLKGSATGAAMTRFAADNALPVGTWKSTDSPYLELAGTWDSYWGALPAKFRSNVRNRLSRLKQIGEPELEILSEKAAITGAFDDAWRLEASGWKDQEGTSITSDPAVRRFYTLLAERAIDRGWLRLMFLTVGRQRIAVSYSAVHDGRLFLLKTGHDRDFHTCSPFKLLTYLAAQHGYANGLREIDFLGDTEPWKQEWTPASRAHDWVYLFSNSRRARLLHSIKFQMAPEIRKWRA